MNRRWRNLLARRGSFQPVPPAAPAAPPWVPPALEPAGFRPRWARTRKATFLAVPPVSVVVTTPPAIPAKLDQAGSRPRWLRTRRGAFFAVRLVGLAPTAPTLPPPISTRHPAWVSPPARGRFQPVPRPAPVVLGTRRPQAKLPAPRRSARFPVIPTQVPSLAVWVPTQARRSPQRSLRIRRGQFQLIPRTITPVTSPCPPKLQRTRRHVVAARRSCYFGVPPVGPAPGFVCQDFTATVAVDLYAAVATADSYTSVAAADRYAATSTPDTYSGVATNCGR